MRLLLAWYAFFILVVHVVGCVFWVVSTNTHNFQLVTFNSQTTVLSVVFSLFYFFQYVKELILSCMLCVLGCKYSFLQLATHNLQLPSKCGE